MSARRLEEKVALVTGAATGIGKAIAQRLAADGASVAVIYLDQPELARLVVDAIETRGARAFAARADVARAAELRAAFDETEARFGRIDIVVNNAAWSITKRIVDVTEQEIDRIIDVNVKGTLYGCQEAARRLANGGRIINLSSSTTALTLPGYGVYDATKGAVEQLARFLAHELGDRGITVNTVSPGATETEQFRAGKTEQIVEQLARLSAFGRLGRVDDIADVVAFLASEEARWITGQNLRVNGGTV